MHPLELGAGLHIWWCAPERLAAPSQRARCEALLADDELEASARLRFERNRAEYLAAHALVRCVLSLYAEVPAAAWRFAASEHGKPEVVAPAGVAAPRFSLSHTGGLVACAVAAGAPVGVDVERLSRRVELLEIAARFFAPDEAAALERLPAPAQRERFFEYWTLKEAYVKALGRGLSVPLERFSFELERAGEIGLRFDPDFEDRDAGAWQFALLEPEPDFRLAVALRHPRGVAELRGGCCVPLETTRADAAEQIAQPLAALRCTPVR